MFKNRRFFEELLKKLLNDFAASRRKLLKNPFLSNFSCLKKTLGGGYGISLVEDFQDSVSFCSENPPKFTKIFACGGL